MHRLAHLSLRFPLPTLTVVASLTVVFGVGVTKLRTDAGFRSYLGPQHPSVLRLDRFIERFGGGLPAAIVWSCEPPVCRSVFDDVSLEVASELTRSLSRLPGVRRIDGLAATPLIVPVDDGIAVRYFVEEGKLAPDRNVLAGYAMSDPFWNGRLVSEDATVTAVIVALSSSDTFTNSSVVEAMRDQAAMVKQRGMTAHLVGDPVAFVLAAEDLEADARRLVPLMMFLILLVVYLLFRSWKSALIILTSITIPLVWTFGTAGWLGWPRTAVSQALGPFILVIGVCDGMHLLSRYRAFQISESSNGWRARAALVKTTRELSLPCLFTSLTTAGGFLSFTATPLESLARFGALAAIGVSYALIVSFTLLPVLLLMVASPRPEVENLAAWRTVIHSLLRAISRRTVPITLTCVCLTVVGVYGARQLRVDANIHEVFGEDSEVAQGLRFAQAHLRGASALEIELIATEMSLYEHAVFQRFIRDTVQFIPSIENVEGVWSVLDISAHLFRLLRPQSRVSQDYDGEILFAVALGQGALIDEWISLDGKRVRISTEIQQTSVSRAGATIQRIEEYLRREVPSGVSYTLTGSFAVEYDLMTQVQDVQVRSFGIAWAVISVLLVLFLRSLRLAVLGMLVTTAPVVMTLGAMGLWGINLDIGTAMVGAVVLGIAVDDTIHLLSRYRLCRMEGVGRVESIHAAVLHVGRAVITTSVALVLGFFSMTTSSWESVANFGLLSGIAILAALGADLILLPALVSLFENLRVRRGS